MTDSARELVHRLRAPMWKQEPADIKEVARLSADLIEQQAREIERLQADGIHSCHDECPRTACVLRREIAGLRAALGTQACIRPSHQQESDGYGYVTVNDCIAAGNCGCDCRAAMREGKP